MSDTQEQLAGLTQHVANLANEASALNHRLASAVTTSETKAQHASDEADRSEAGADRAEPAATRAEAAADRADEIAELETVRDALRLAAVPAPDFHLPLISDLQIREGFGDPDQIDISPAQDGSQMIDLPTRSAYFSRASTKWYTNKSGVLTKVEVDEPAFEQEGILIEGSSTNLVSHSHQPRSEGVLFPAVKFIDGLTEAIRVEVIHARASWPLAIPIYKTGQTVKHTISLYVKKETAPSVYITTRRYNSGGFEKIADLNYDFATGWTEHSDEYWDKHPPVLLENGWVRLSFTPKEYDGFYNFGDGSVYPTAYDGASKGDSIFVGGAQLEALPFASSYIPTNGSPVTRAADTLAFSTPNNFTLGDTTTSMRIKVNGQASNFGRIWNGGDRNKVYIVDGESDRMNLRGYWDKDQNWGRLSNNEHWFDGIAKEILIIRKQNRVISYHNGEKIADIPATAPTNLSSSIFLANGSGLSAYLKDVRIWHRALTPEQIATLG